MNNDPSNASSSSGSRRKKRRWGDGPPPDASNGVGSSTTTAIATTSTTAAPATTPTAPPPSTSAASDPKARAAALQASIQARLAALKARTAANVATAAAAIQPAPGAAPVATTAAAEARSNSDKSKKRAEITPSDADEDNGNDNDKSINPKAAKRARVFELDLTSTAPARLLEKQQREEQLRSLQPETTKEKINPYLAHLETPAASSSTKDGIGGTTAKTYSSVDNAQVPLEITTNSAGNRDATENDTLLDTRLAGGHVAKTRLRHRPLNFVAPGTYIALGEKKRQAAARAEESGYVSGRKDGRVIQSVGMGGVAADGGGAHVVEGTKAGGSGSYYGVGEAGKVIEQRLPARVDAPELEIEDFVKKVSGGKRKQLGAAFASATASVDDEKAAVAAAIRAAETTMPYAMEWWDAELLPSKLRKELASEEGRVIASRARKQVALSSTDKDDDNTSNRNDDNNPTPKELHQKLIERCYKHASLTHSRTHTLVQHPVPILTPAQRAALDQSASKKPTLHLTKAERKRHRKLRRAERLREQQDLQAAGLLPPPEPRLTLSNYMKVLGDQAVLDPSKMEARVVEQIQARKRKHEKMNEERKLTKEEKAAKHARKLQEDTSRAVKVALFWVRDMSHPYHRAKVDLNAQQNSITGGVLECEVPELALVVAEGGEKAIKRYTRLMTVRMRWKGEDFYVSDEEDDDMENVGENGMAAAASGGSDDQAQPQQQKPKKFNPNNECELIWTGMAMKRAFHSFMFQSAANSTVARKILEAKKVAHYWDLAISHVEAKEGAGIDGVDLNFRLGAGNDTSGYS
mmetsp:Transcript_20210/g.42069  ORF Transcript_20210/g.42069 Transcript_20210/m.42069 type:complete len:807 (+) Transcript_20210:124-2544(+)